MLNTCCKTCGPQRCAGRDVHESVHRNTFMKVTNKMQLYGLIYYY